MPVKYALLPIFMLGLLVQAAHAEPIAIAVHGGAGTLARENLSEEAEQEIRAALEQAVRAGHAVLETGGHSVDAVVAAVKILEDAPQFNAGRGAVLTAEGTVEMDASLMDGATLNAGAVASVTGIRHAIEAAHRVMTATPHVMLVGQGAESFAREQELEFMDEDWFITERRRQQLTDMQSDAAVRPKAGPNDHWGERWHSTVGAVALDRHGNLAAATSTGGMANKRWGRVGDSPVIGAGTYADNRSCAVSGTGHGEYFIRHAVAYDICARAVYTGRSLNEAADEVIFGVLKTAGGDGGVIAIAPDGSISMPFNTSGMYRAAIDTDGRLEVAIFGDD